jgi:PAS domain S-box-containing protein
MKAALPGNELTRLAHLHALNILDTGREQSFDDLAQLAAMICEVPIALVSLIDHERQWFKSCIGLDVTETPRDLAFCAHAILQPGDLLVVEDATRDPRFSDNPLVLGEPRIRFYAGAPLVSEEGYAFGTLCVIDTAPRRFDSSQATALKLLAGQVIQLLELREANQALQTSQLQLQERSEQLNTILSNFPGAVYRCLNDARWTMLYLSDKVEQLTGYPSARFMGDGALSISDITHPEDVPMVYQQVQEALRQQQAFQIIYRLRDGDGNWCWIEELGCGVFDKSGALKYIDGFIWDISERKRAEQIKNDFVSAVSHELRTPLTSISGALGLIVGGMLGAPPEKMQSMLVIAHKNALRLTQLINDLLDMEKLIAGKMGFDLERQPLVPIIEQSLETNKAYADSFNVSLHLSVCANEQDVPLMVSLDAHRLQQVMANFISNAVKYSPPQGRVEIQLIQLQGEVKIAVVDHGPGISEEFRERLFQKFTQADSSASRQRGGTGLGLAISKTFVERMHGRIGFDSIPGQGATFYAIFPLANRATDLVPHH